ncbi:MAG: hypothetical protein ACK59Y_02915 [Betaproteobacteria bacterium]|jgi:hypothetical protein|nr:hypothetical protein [Betaproteobacteria bacterium]
MTFAAALVGFFLSVLFLLGPLALQVATAIGVTFTVIGLPLVPAFTIGIVPGVILYILISVLLYVAASAATGPRPADGQVTPSVPVIEEVCRGLLLGINASGQLLFTPVAYAALVPVLPLPFLGLLALSVPIAVYLSLLNLAASVAAGNRTYNAFLGWSSVLSPMSWPVTLVGATLAVWSLIMSGLGFPLRVTMEWWTLTLVFHGTVPAFFPTAYNLGNFSFITVEFRAQSPSPALANTGFAFTTADGVTFHETGHTLSVGAFGPAFHYIGALDENVFGGGENAYAEIIAESQQRDADRPFLSIWTPPVGPIAGPAGANTRPTVAAPWPAVIPPAVAAVGQMIPLDASTGVADPDGYPLAAINPGGTPPLGFLWLIQAPPGSLAALANDAADPNIFVPDLGGDYTWRALLTDGLNGNARQAILSVVQARANGPYAGAPNAAIPLSAAGSTAGSAGALPSVAAAGAPVLTLAWTVTLGGAIATLNNPTSESPTFTAPVGNYEVTLTATAAGVSHTAIATVTVA